MKKIYSLIIVSILILSGCGTDPLSSDAVEQSDHSEELQLKVVTPYGTPTLSMVKMMVENPVIDENTRVSYEAIESTDVLTTTLINNEADIAVVPTNLAAVMYNKEIGYKLVGTSVWGILYIVSSEDISNLEDLKGKTISALGRNVTPDAMLRYVLTENGIRPDEDVTIEYFSGASELATNYIAGESNTALMPEPVLTNVLMKREDSKVVINLQEEWQKLTGLDDYPQASMIVKESLIESNPEVVQAFIKEYSQSITWLNENPAEAGTYYESLGIGLKAPIVERAIPGCGLNYVSASEAKESIETYLGVLFEFNPQLLGGKLVDEGLYFEE